MVEALSSPISKVPVDSNLPVRGYHDRVLATSNTQLQVRERHSSFTENFSLAGEGDVWVLRF